MLLNFYRFVLLTGLSFMVRTATAQLQVKNINRLPQQQINETQARIRAADDTISLPFWDDFSFASILPDTGLWSSNTGALINGTLGSNTPSLNVASFDGSDLFGNPHDPSGVNSQTVDVLTSKAIDLGSLPVEKWDSVYFSFYWQMGGLAEAPEQRDSLKVDFLDEDGIWNQVFDLEGSEENFHETFTQKHIQVSLEKYFHPGFKFRFRTAGNSLGPYDAWHIDYVYLNIDRYENDESLEDGAIASMPTSIFSQYSMIPYDVLFDFPDTIYSPMVVEVSSFLNGVYLVEAEVNLRDTLLNTVVASQPPTTGNSIKPFDRSTFTANAITSADLMAVPTDSLFLELEIIFNSQDEYFIKEVTNNGTSYLIDDEYNYRLNDTVRSYHEVHHTLAYDDGVAEYAAGLNKYESQLAVYFNLPSEDTLTSIDIYFPQFVREAGQSVSPSGQRIVLSVLEDLSGDANAVLRSQEFVINGGAGLNEFERFTLDRPVIVSGEFYISIQQFTSDYVGIGLDNNNPIGTQKLWVNLEEKWEPNLKVEGMVMIRGIFEDSDYVVSSVNDLERTLKIYPNPASDQIHIAGDFYRFELMDVSGKVLKSGYTQLINVANLMNGVYFLKVSKIGSFLTRKVLIRH